MGRFDFGRSFAAFASELQNNHEPVCLARCEHKPIEVQKINALLFRFEKSDRGDDCQAVHTGDVPANVVFVSSSVYP